MLTIKHISPDGNEALYQSPEISYTRGQSSAGDFITPATVWYKAREGASELHPLTGGEVFVMNDHGATVGRYWLEDGGGTPA